MSDLIPGIKPGQQYAATRAVRNAGARLHASEHDIQDALDALFADARSTATVDHPKGRP